ncbi:hypothetical protein F441_22880 [Phytophthora nicotianae CJ01A1]|uniref:Uncharacterized protein n=1 Tax=Phytophthora nicotianae CJ01A1 TaxID=1317063 RepID=W2VNF8_PHYNI|nr:hypothetical protein F441_22880 [Phytophthora nicotianae CJ01A1]
MGGSKRKKFLHYLKEVSGKPLQQKDVEDMIAEMRRETYTSSDDNVRVSQLLQDFGEGPGNAVRIFRDPATSLTSYTVSSVLIREQILSGKNPTATELGGSILDVGTFSILDIERMRLWHEVSRKLLKARKLMKFVENIPSEGDAQSKKRQQILKTIPHMGVDTVYHTGGHDIPFTELARFGDESWLSDTCVYLASQRVAEERQCCRGVNLR